MFNENDLTVENMKFFSREAALKENTRISELKNNVIASAFNSVKSKLSNEFGTSITLDSPKTNLTEFTPNTLSGKIVATLSVDTIDGVKRVPVTFKVRASVATLAESMEEIKDKLDKTEGSLESEIRNIMASQEQKIKNKEEEEKLAKQIEADIMKGISLEASKNNRIFKEAKKEEIDMHTIQDNPVGNALPPQILTYPKAYLPEMKKDKSIINIGGFKYKYIGDEPTITGDTENGVIARFALIPMGKKASLNKVSFGEINEENFTEKMQDSFDGIKDYDTAAKLAEQLAEENNNLRNHNGTLYLVREEDLNILNKFDWDLLDFTDNIEASVKTQAEEDQTVEGWSNYNTWNVALLIDNTRPLYEKMVEYVNQEDNPTYDGLISFMGLEDEFTVDGVSYQDKDLNKAELDKWVKNHKDDLAPVNASLETKASKLSKEEWNDLVHHSKEVGGEVWSENGMGLVKILSYTEYGDGSVNVELDDIDDSEENLQKFEMGGDNPKLYLLKKEEYIESEASLEKSATDYSNMTSNQLKNFVKPYAESKENLPKDLADAVAFFPSVVSDYASQIGSIENLDSKLTEDMKNAIKRTPKEAFNIFNSLSKGNDFDSFPEFIKDTILGDMDVLREFAKKKSDSLSESVVNAISENPDVMLELLENGNIRLPENVKKDFNDRLKELGYADAGPEEVLKPEEEQAQKDMEEEQDNQEETEVSTEEVTVEENN